MGVDTAPHSLQRENVSGLPFPGDGPHAVTFMSPGALRIAAGLQDPYLTDGKRGKQAICCRRFFVLCFIKSETGLLVLSASMLAGPLRAWAGVRAPLALPWIPTRHPGCGTLSWGSS